MQPSWPRSRLPRHGSSGAAVASFGFQAQGVIGGVVYEDANGDGTRQAYEQVLGSVTVAIFTARPNGVFNTDDDVQAGEQSTAKDGTYRFLDQPLNVYSVRDPDDALLVYSVTGLPAGLTIDTATGLIAGQLPQGSAGSYAITATDTDTLGATGQATFTLTVEKADDGLYLYLPAIHNGVELNIHLYFPAVYR